MLKEWLKEWDEKHNWGLLVVGLFSFLITIVGVNVYTIHIEDMAHIKQGHCKTPSIGTDNKYWVICK